MKEIIRHTDNCHWDSEHFTNTIFAEDRRDAIESWNTERYRHLKLLAITFLLMDNDAKQIKNKWNHSICIRYNSHTAD